MSDRDRDKECVLYTCLNSGLVYSFLVLIMHETTDAECTDEKDEE